MAIIKQIISTIIALFAFIYTFYAMGKLIVFLSPFSKISIAETWIINLLDNKSKLEASLYPILYNIILIYFFVLQHSLMKTVTVNQFLDKIGLDLAKRAIYSLATSYTLLNLVNNWKSVSTIVAWQYNVEDKSITWWLLLMIHIIAWAFIYGECIIMDLPEMIGVKHVYYDIMGYSSPIHYKSYALRRMYKNCRHPSFIELFIILWTTNCMTLDRLLLAVLLPLYMLIAFKTDNLDMEYSKEYFQRKQEQLKIMFHDN